MKTHAIHTCVSFLQTDMIQQQIRFLKWNTRDKKRNLIKTMGYLHSFELVGFLSLFKLSYLQSQQIKQETNTGGFIVKLCSLILSSIRKGFHPNRRIRHTILKPLLEITSQMSYHHFGLFCSSHSL